MQRDGIDHHVNMTVRPVHETGSAPLVLVVFDEGRDTTSVERPAEGDASHPMLVRLEDELGRAREQL
jgi:hypothetical protein